MPNKSESLPEVLKRVNDEKSRNKKIEILKKADGAPLQTILQGAYHPKIVWALPPGSPPYKPVQDPYGLCPSILEREIRKLPYLCENPQMVQNKIKRESIFIQMLESVHPSEAELFIQMVNKDIKCNGLTQLLVHEIWPDLVPKPETKKKEAEK